LLAGCGAGINAVLLVALNRHIYRFFWKQRGTAFTMAAVPIHWLYYFYSGLVWIYCFASHYMGAIFHPPSIMRAEPIREFRAEDYQRRSAKTSAPDAHV
jgi:hypothetical protein